MAAGFVQLPAISESSHTAKDHKNRGSIHSRSRSESDNGDGVHPGLSLFVAHGALCRDAGDSRPLGAECAALTPQCFRLESEREPASPAKRLADYPPVSLRASL